MTEAMFALIDNRQPITRQEKINSVAQNLRPMVDVSHDKVRELYAALSAQSLYTVAKTFSLSTEQVSEILANSTD